MSQLILTKDVFYDRVISPYNQGGEDREQKQVRSVVNLDVDRSSNHVSLWRLVLCPEE